MKDNLGDRMKENYENRTRNFLPRRTNTIIRLDGKAFHTFTRNFKKPFDEHLMNMMDLTALKLCENIQGAVIGYVQSDEISILLQDFEKITTDAWFDGNIQKIVSVSASMATGYFNNYLRTTTTVQDIAFFDSRTFTIAEKEEVINYFLWRQKDAVRNSISMTAQSLYSHKELEGKSSSQKQEMCFQKGVNWNNIGDGKKRGRMIIKDRFIREIPTGFANDGIQTVETFKWTIKDAIDFQKDREVFSQYLETKIYDELVA